MTEPEFSIEDALGFLINRLAFLTRQAAQETFQQQGHSITTEEWVLLNRLWEKDGRRPSDLACMLIKDRTTMTRLVDSLVRKGMVRRKRDAQDRRVVCAWLTPKGQKLKQELRPAVMKLIDAAVAGIPAKDLETTRQTLKKAHANLLARKIGKR